jgi:peptidoglycan hydrolase CwlO-like protein
MEKDISLLKENSVNKNDFKDLQNEVEKINGHIKQSDRKIDECKF